MIIYQVHEQHGKHMSQSSIEAQANEKNGWKTVSKDEFYGAKPEKESVKPVEIDQELIDAHIAKFGKKPHPNAKPETIIEKLNADSE